MASNGSLENLVSAMFYFAGRWSPGLKTGQARDVLRHLLCKLYGTGQGNLFHAKVRASHAAIAAEVGLSREWTCTLLGRLQEAGWLTYSTVRLPDGKFEIGVFGSGRMLKRLLCLLIGYRRPRPNRVKGSSQSSTPNKEEIKKNLSFLQKLREELAQKLKLRR